VVAQPLQRGRGRPRSTKSEEEQKLAKRLKHRQAQNKYHKKTMMMTKQNKKKHLLRKEKARARLAKLLGP